MTPRKKYSRSRKTSTVPSRVFRFGLRPPTVNADLVEALFAQTRVHGNQLVTIENVSRNRYRMARARLFPAYGALEDRYQKLEIQIQTLRKQIDLGKSTARSRAVDPVLKNEIAVLKNEKKSLAQQLKEMRPSTTQDPELIEIGASANADARAATKALRKTIYWGTYQLIETAVQQASRDTPFEVAYNMDPPHQLSSRIGVQIQGGMSVADLSTDTQLRISPLPKFRPHRGGPLFARGSWARTTLAIRIASDEKNHPVWAEFPMVMHRPLPNDARIMGAYVTRRRDSVRIPWRYDLCIGLESNEFERTTSSPSQIGTTAINFGWRHIDGKLRVATVNPEGKTPFEILLPRTIVKKFHTCDHLQSLVDTKLDEVKKTLHAWISARESELPAEFLESFRNLPAWKSNHRLAELVWYWRDHRVPGDDLIYPIMEQWKDRYRHLGDWLDNQRQHLLDWRTNYYRKFSRWLALHSRRILIDDFQISAVAKRPDPEDELEGGQLARRNRTIVSPSQLRLFIKQACAKYHCEAIVSPTTNNTRRCNVCGELYEWDPARELVHTCPGDGSTWDQDVNNTDNLHDRAASGEVITLVTPAEIVVKSEGCENVVPSSSLSFRDAREQLHNSLKTK